MKPLISPRCYTDANRFRMEMQRIFMRRWFFAGATHGLENDGDFRCIEIGGVSVVLQNFGGQIRAFNNVCTHRFSRLQTAPAGNRELKCPYHGWTFNEAGLPYAIPRKPLIAEVTPATLCDYRLSRWHLRTAGPLLFIRKEHAGETLAADDLERQFGDFFAPLVELASACGELVENTEHVVKANWKLVVENTLEGYHVDCVHPNTIRKLGMSGLSKGTNGTDETNGAPTKGSTFRFSGGNSAVFSPLNPEVSARMDRTYKFLANRPQRLDGYRHFYFFPAFVFASTRGESFSIQRILPIDEQTTQLTSFLFATNGLGELTKMEAALKKQFYQSAGDFVREIFAEDAAICEQVQRAVGYAHTTGVLSDEEERICAFHTAYRAALEPRQEEQCQHRAHHDPARCAGHACSRKLTAERAAFATTH
jgi:phenylpropionate dioxygenase-like ring-hydroxylating dioxygenase large terminal subunit